MGRKRKLSMVSEISADNEVASAKRDGTIARMLNNVPLGRIVANPFQPASRQADVKTRCVALAANIADEGLHQPAGGRVILDGVVVQQLPFAFDNWGDYLQKNQDALVQLAWGHTRAAAFEHNRDNRDDKERWQALPTLIRSYSDLEMAKANRSENVSRSDLTAIDEAEFFQTCINTFGWNQSQVAEHIGVNRATVSNKLRILNDLPKAMRDKLQAGEISERQAVAMLQAYQLPEPARKAAKMTQSYYDVSIKDVEKALQDGKSSGELREMVRKVIGRVTFSLSEVKFDAEFAYEDAKLRQPTCVKCPMRQKIAKDDRCGDEACYRLKEAAAARIELDAIGVTHDVPVVHGKQPDTFDYTLRDRAKKEVAAPVRCENLAVAKISYPSVPAGKEKGFGWVCQRRGGCQCAKRWKKEVKADDPTAGLKKQLQNDVVKPAVDGLVRKLEEMDYKAWYAVLNYGNRESRPMETIIRDLPKSAVLDALSYNGHENIAGERETVQVLLGRAGASVDFPELSREQRVVGVRKKYESVEGALKRMSHGKLDVGQIDGYVGYLRNLRDNFEALNDDLSLDDDIRRVISAIELLNRLRNFAFKYQGEIDSVYPLVYEPINSIYFTNVLRAATVDMLRLALVFVDGDQVRTERLKKHLNGLQAISAETLNTMLAWETFRDGDDLRLSDNERVVLLLKGMIERTDEPGMYRPNDEKINEFIEMNFNNKEKQDA